MHALLCVWWSYCRKREQKFWISYNENILWSRFFEEWQIWWRAQNSFWQLVRANRNNTVLKLVPLLVVWKGGFCVLFFGHTKKSADMCYNASKSSYHVKDSNLIEHLCQHLHHSKESQFTMMKKMILGYGMISSQDFTK